MRWPNVKLIFLRELIDQLRDRRTLFMILVLPILLYPSIGIGMIQFFVRFTEQPRDVVVIGQEHLPRSPVLIQGDRFAADLFKLPEDAEKLRIVDAADAESALRNGEVQLILIVPSDIRQRIDADEEFELQTVFRSADDKSRFADLLLKEALARWKQSIIERRIAARALRPDFASPFVVHSQDLATPSEVAGGLLWGKLLPFLLVIMSLTGAFYPAVDLCAGEKERGTIETLLISPAGRGEIVLGKYLTIWIFSISTAILNLLSMAATGWVVARQMKAALPENAPLGVLTPPSLIDALWIVLLLVPLAAFFSALSIALAAFARSTKEGHYYLTPLFIITMPLVLVSLAPGIELNAFYSIVPVTGAALLLKTLILGQYALAFEFFVPVLLPTVLYAVLALRWAIDQFNREDVLFREAERINPWLWFRHLLRDKGAFPSAAESMFCYAIMLLLVWFLLLSGLLSPAMGVDARSQQAALQQSIIVLQVAFVAAPSLIMAAILTSSLRQTLMILTPRWIFVALAFVLALTLHPIIVEAGQHIQRGIPGQPKWIEETIKMLLGGGQPLWWQIFLIAFLPAVCEEIAFRGFILSGLLRRMSPATAIIVSGFLFGFFHMNPQQLLTATVLGWVLGVIATRSGSLLPGILFHFANNSLALLMSSLQDRVETLSSQGQTESGWVTLFHALYRQPMFGDTIVFHVPYKPAVLVICSLAATLLLTWLFKQPVRAPAALEQSGSSDAQSTADGGFGGNDVASDAQLRTFTHRAHDATS